MNRNLLALLGLDQVGSREMIDPRWHLWVIHGVRHVPHQGHLFTNFDHLTNPEGSPEHAHVEVHSAQDDIISIGFRSSIFMPRFPCFDFQTYE
jgi:hypothetical protein